MNYHMNQYDDEQSMNHSPYKIKKNDKNAYNEMHKEFIRSLEQFRHFNYQRNRIQHYASYSYSSLCSILYHYVSIIRLMLKLIDTRRYDQKLKQLIQANATLLIENPEKSNHLPKLGQFNETEFILIHLDHSIDEINNLLGDFHLRQQFMWNIINQLNPIFINSPMDMAYSFYLHNNYLLCCFQYNSINAQLLNKQEKIPYIIARIYDFCNQDLEQASAKRPLKILIDNSRTPRNEQISQLIHTSINTAFQWFDSSRYTRIMNTERCYTGRSLTPQT